jgi:hypothetical protein
MQPGAADATTGNGCLTPSPPSGPGLLPGRCDPYSADTASVSVLARRGHLELLAQSRARSSRVWLRE